MKTGRTRRGQAFILFLIVLLAVLVAFALLSTQSARVRSTPTVQDVFWQVGGQRATTVTMNDEVEAHVVVKATEEYVGSIVVKVRKDISFWSDSDYSIKTVPLNLKGDQVTELEFAFVPDQASGRSLRGYFIEIDFSATRTEWVMENSYPPRLKVLPRS
jgi:hypothetical protein